VGHVVLVGLPGVGKTTMATALAERWHIRAVDTDELVASAVGVSVATYLRDEGEATFRQRELEALYEALGHDGDAVIATGGGIVTSSQARDALAEQCTFWLDCDDDVILSRLGDVERPLLAEDPTVAIARLRLERGEWYREVSTARIDTSRSIDDAVAHVTCELDRLAR
jgi:shikimate kinase